MISTQDCHHTSNTSASTKNIRLANLWVEVYKILCTHSSRAEFLGYDHHFQTVITKRSKLIHDIMSKDCLIKIEALIYTWTFEKRCALVERTEVKQTQEL